MSFEQLGGIRPAKIRVATTEVWQLGESGSLPKACDTDLLKVDGRKTVSAQGGSSWLAANSGAACTIRSKVLSLAGGDGKTVAKLQVTPDGKAGARVFPAGGYARFEVVTNGLCVSSTRANANRKTQQLRVQDRAGGRLLGTVTAVSAACKGETIQLVLLPYTEAVRTSVAPAGLTARLMTATLQQKAKTIAGTLFVTNTAGKPFHTSSCPTVLATITTSKVQAQARSTMTCDEGFTIPARASVGIEVKIPVAVSIKDFVLADVGAYLTIGIGDDASRARPDA